uniref:Uncharacterized protein n=1 Tax=Glossina palpalis gambiensis TaxID=67801 RepID=A0A1B0C178_9MUSC
MRTDEIVNKLYLINRIVQHHNALLNMQHHNYCRLMFPICLARSPSMMSGANLIVRTADGCGMRHTSTFTDCTIRKFLSFTNDVESYVEVAHVSHAALTKTLSASTGNTNKPPCSPYVARNVKHSATKIRCWTNVKAIFICNWRSLILLVFGNLDLFGVVSSNSSEHLSPYYRQRGRPTANMDNEELRTTVESDLHTTSPTLGSKLSSHNIDHYSMINLKFQLRIIRYKSLPEDLFHLTILKSLMRLLYEDVKINRHSFNKCYYNVLSDVRGDCNWLFHCMDINIRLSAMYDYWWSAINRAVPFKLRNSGNAMRPR